VLRFQWFLLPALLLVLVDTFLAERRPARRRRQAAAAQTVAAALLMAVVLGGCAEFRRNGQAVAAFHDGDFTRAAALFRQAIEGGDGHAETLYNFGTALLQADSLESAAEVLDRLREAPDTTLRINALFNLGLAHLLQGLAAPADQAERPLGAALAAYKSLLVLAPDHLDAKWNYELALRRQDENSGGGGGGGGGQSQDPQSGGQDPQSAGGLDQRQAEQILGSAAREERDTQASRQRQTRAEPPPGGKDW
jgi:Ca-activated chloride channel homolog